MNSSALLQALSSDKVPPSTPAPPRLQCCLLRSLKGTKKDPVWLALPSLRGGHFPGGQSGLQGLEASLLLLLPSALGHSLSASLIPRGLTQPGRPTALPHIRCPKRREHSCSEPAWVGSRLVSPCSHLPFAPRAAQAGLDWTGDNRSQHSREGLGRPGPGTGLEKAFTPQCPEVTCQD